MAKSNGGYGITWAEFWWMLKRLPIESQIDAAKQLDLENWLPTLPPDDVKEVVEHLSPKTQKMLMPYIPKKILKKLQKNW